MQTTSRADYGYLRQLVFAFSQNVLDPSRDALFETRLSRLLRQQGMTHLHQLVHHLRTRKDAALERTVAETMLTRETSFFRDGRPFDLLRADLLPRLIEQRRAARALRFWSAACSTGQEAYSLAILLRKDFPSLADWNIRIEGTDLSAEAVARARIGRYHRIEINRGLPARLVTRYFDHEGEEFAVKPQLSALCSFRPANLCASPLPFHEPFDIIFLRNVMLYFAQGTRRTLLTHIHRLLAPDGFLFLGSSEQPADPSLWTPVLAGGTCYFTPRERSQGASGVRGVSS
jgi:chemotaxis protein methyltransferase CheR